jgi:hypothetical protein
MLHLPLLRQGRPYRSLEVARVPHFRTRETVVEVSQANPGLVRRDLLDDAQAGMREGLAHLTVRELLDLSARAARSLAEDELPLGDGTQTAEDYVRQVSATTGLPHVLVRRNLEKVRGVLADLPAILAGLTRGLDLAVLDRGRGEALGHALSFIPRSPTLGIVLPSNSPGVHALWVPAIALKTALVLKPGAVEPWTPFRIVQAFLEAGAPAAAFGYYPTDHAGAGEVLRRCGRAMVFGDLGATRAWRNDPRLEVHGPGYSKVVLGPDRTDWPGDLDVMIASIAENGGRSCVNASGVWVTDKAAEIAEALATRLATIRPRPEDDPEAALAPFPDPRAAERISAAIDAELAKGGARDVTATHRSGGRLVAFQGATYLLPTIVLCDSPDHPLANREYLFPFASVVPVAAEDLPARLGPTLAATVLTEDPRLLERFLASPLVHRINLGRVPTCRVSWDQPHEGNLFEHLYARRALQGTGEVA